VSSFFGFGIELLDEADYDIAEEEWALISRVRDHGVLDADIEGSVLATGNWFEPYPHGPGCHGEAHKLTYEEWVTKDHRTPKEKERDDLIKHLRELKEQKDYERQLRVMSEQAMTQSNMGLRSWAARQATLTPEQREEEYARQVAAAAETRRLAASRLEHARIIQRRADEEHERRRLWSIEVSEIERSIFESTENIDCSVLDRTMMRTMLRYQNFGPGMGKAWDAREFVLYISATRRDDLLKMTLRDVERCYDTLKNLVVNAE
jgi:uncharacterized protein with PIN domain